MSTTTIWRACCEHGDHRVSQAEEPIDGLWCEVCARVVPWQRWVVEERVEWDVVHPEGRDRMISEASARAYARDGEFLGEPRVRRVTRRTLKVAR